jgi:hypothetical protein
MDEQPLQLLKETRVPLAATKKHGQRVDYEYERNGTASILRGVDWQFRIEHARVKLKRLYPKIKT